jgi:DNA polymerase-3 subunit alpha (Gram-positive type)
VTKVFNEVFPGISLDDTLREYFNDAIIERIFHDQRNNTLYVHMTLNKIVYPEYIEKQEEAIKYFIDASDEIKVVIIEKFQISDPMPFKFLYDYYIGAIVYNLKKVNPICGHILQKTKPSISDDTVIYQVSNQQCSYMNSHKIENLIVKTFKEKFDLDIKVAFEKYEGKDLAERFMEGIELEQKKIIKKMAIEENQNTTLPKKVVKKEPKNDNDKSTNLVIGRHPIKGEVTYITQIGEETNDVIVEVNILSLETRELRSGKILLIFNVTDYSGSITCKCFLNAYDYEEQTEKNLRKGMFARIKGKLQFDDFQKENIIYVNSLEEIDDFLAKREDTAEEKRVELHLHTNMSDMDGICSAKGLVKQAIAWGHKAIAITDHGVVQGFPDAFHAADGSDIKIIYGVEGYLIDDEKPTVRNEKGQSFEDEYVVFDIETTGFFPGMDKITEIGAVKIKNKQIVDRFSTFVNPERGIPIKVQELTRITPEMVKDAPTIDEVMKDFMDFSGDAILVAHNADFDLGFMKYYAERIGLAIDNTSIDTLELARLLLKELNNYKLNTVAKFLKIPLDGHHRAVVDAEATAEIMLKLMEEMNQMNIHSLRQLNDYEMHHLKNYKKLRPSHCIILAKNLIGLRNLYELISKSHIEYFYSNRPRIPKSVLREYREGLLIGSACEAGELYTAVYNHRAKEEIDRIASFYDYFEIQPLGNNEFLTRDNPVEGEKALIEANKTIIELGKTYNKLVVATCDVHFLNPEDEVYRRILMAGKGFKDADSQPPLYFRTTKEMLDEFYYLTDQEAYEVVVENTNKIADMIEKIEPVPREKFPPKIEGAEEELTKLCYDKAKAIYGENLPEIVEERLKRELHSIISNGFAVMYIIAQKLVAKSNEDGYLVGSRGSVGSSFAATMSGITEVNPLSAHYICPNCHYVDFDSEVVKAHAGSSGCGLPDAKCPECGHDLIKEGHDIPFETFLGFKGNKEPDIDLNFSGEYQGVAHKYTEEIFGEGHVFRAGTIGTLADKTAFGYVKKYFDEKNIHINRAETDRLVIGCTGVRKTTGQHPGGIIVVPKDQSIYRFTPVQRPANDMTSTTITTHFDYHSIDHNLLKLDILGHDDPTMIRMLEDLTGVNAQTIPLDEPKVMSLFESTEALSIKPEDISGCKLGSLGIPELGTDFVIQMLLDTKPKSFSDLVRISGLSHGTDVWLNNAQVLVKEGKANISTVISTRDDIMTYLINQGVDKEESFTIMESVRKGKGLKPEMEEIMIKNGVPDWYIWSCKQIKYMFPKAHAVAYVMMAYRIAYFKVYYPLEYYATYYSIRSSNFDYEIMCNGKEQLEEYLKDYKDRLSRDELSKKEKDTIKDMHIVQEMYARGFEFTPIDLYTVDAKKFQIFDGKIMASLSAIQGLGEKAAENIVMAREDGEFLSVEDLRNRTKVTKTVIEVMQKNKIINNMQETNQLSLF